MKISFSGHKRLYKDLFGSDQGKQVLHDLANRFYMTSPTIRQGETQEQYLVREGMRQVILYILSNVNYDLNKYMAERENFKLEVEHDK